MRKKIIIKISKTILPYRDKVNSCRYKPSEKLNKCFWKFTLGDKDNQTPSFAVICDRTTNHAISRLQVALALILKFGFKTPKNNF